MNTIQVPRRFVTHPWGGTETVVLETSKRLIAGGHPTAIYTSVAMSDSRFEEIEGVPVHRYKHIYPYLGLDRESVMALDQKGGNLFSFQLLRAIQKATPLDVLHLHTGKRMGGIVRKVALQRQIPYLLSLHGGLLDVPQEEARSWTQPTEGKFEWGQALGAWVGARRVVDDASAVICVSSAEADIVRKRWPQVRVEVLPNGVDPSKAVEASGDRWRKENNVALDAPLVTVVGRIDPQKGQLAAVEAVAALRERIPDLRLALIGGVTNEDYYKRVLDAVGDWAIVVPGYPRGDRRLWDAYAAASVVVVPSRHEPFGIVALEAWASNRPVIASAVGGLAEFIESEKDGLLVPVGDVGALAQAIEFVIRGPLKANHLGDAGHRKMLEQYTWDAITDRLIALYQEVAHARSVRA